MCIPLVIVSLFVQVPRTKKKPHPSEFPDPVGMAAE